MPMNMTEKILARGAGRESVKPGDLLLAKVDFAMGHDLTIPPASKIMREQMGATKVWDPERVAVVQDHFQPAKDTASAALGKTTRDWAKAMGIKWYFEADDGRHGHRGRRQERGRGVRRGHRGGPQGPRQASLHGRLLRPRRRAREGLRVRRREDRALGRQADVPGRLRAALRGRRYQAGP